ncbi:MAG: hypothetical protein HY391_03140, partial [Deltaproteobacteria bacterium]|nr:hypothetical protein [Deltaproteobacteria bacterium]
MATAQLATRIDLQVKKALASICKARGLKINRFIEDAILEKLEEMEDLADLKTLRKEKFRPLSEILKDLRQDGKI